jgi:hypothetical protein
LDIKAIGLDWAGLGWAGLGWGLDDKIFFPGEEEISFLAIMSGPALGSTQLAHQWVPHAFFFL